MEWEVQICVAVCWDEVVFPSGDCAFGCIASVNVGWYELVGHSVVVHKAFKFVRSFVVKDLEHGLEAFLVG